MRRARAALLALLAATHLAAAPRALAGNDPSGVVLLVNEDSPDSVAIGAHYAARRFLPEKQVVRLRVPSGKDLSLADYRRAVEEPLRAHLLREGLEERVRCLVLTKGIPVRVRLGSGVVSTAAFLQAMDLPFAGSPQSGVPGTPLDSLPPEARRNPWREGPFPEDRRPGGVPLRLVTALDGYTAAEAMALVDRSVAADAGPPADPLFVFQDAAGAASGRNGEYAAGMEALRRSGFRVEAAEAGKEAVRDRTDLAGWMSGGSYSGLDDAGVLSNRFAPGALVDMLESFGAVPANFVDDGKRQQYPVSMMVRAGASGVHGAVAEPYAHTFPDTGLFARYASGLDLAESFHASLPYLYWRNLVLGDPLCAPFARRPRVRLDGVPDRCNRENPLEARVLADRSPGGEEPVRVRVFVDGEEAGGFEEREGAVTVHPAALADGDHLLLAVAFTDGPLRTRGWAARTFRVDLPLPRVVAWLPPGGAVAVPPAGPFGYAWSGRPRGTPGLILRDSAGEGVEGKVEAEGNRVLFRPATPLLPGRTYELRATGFADPPPASVFTVGAAALSVEAPAAAVAGEPCAVTVSAPAGADSPLDPLAGERIEVLASDPPVRLAVVDSPGGHRGPLRLTLPLTRAGRATLRVRALRSGAEATASVEVASGPAARLFLRLPPSSPLGEPFDAAVAVQDAHGNPVPDWTGTVTPGSTDGRALLPAPVTVAAGDRGRAVLRGVVFRTEGIHSLTASADGGLEGGDNSRVQPTTVRTWLLSGPHPVPAGGDPLSPRLFPGEDGKRRPTEGSVLAGRPWRRHRAPKGAVEPGEEPGALLAVAYLDCPAESRALLHLGHGGRLRAWWNGREVYAGEAAPKPKEERAKVEVTLPAGPSALVLRAEVRGKGDDDFAARFTLPDGRPVPDLRVLAERPFPPDALSISGTVRGPNGPLAGVEVRLSGRKTARTETDAHGWYGFGELPKGAYRVTVPGKETEPAERKVELEERERVDGDFRAGGRE